MNLSWIRDHPEWCSLCQMVDCGGHLPFREGAVPLATRRSRRVKVVGLRKVVRTMDDTTEGRFRA